MTGSLRLPARLGPLLLFGVLAGLGVAAEHWAVHRVEFAVRPGLRPVVAFDLLVLLPGLFYWLVVRRYQLPLSTLVAALGAGLALCRWLLPGAGLPLLAAWVGWLLPGAEALVLGYTTLRLRRMVQAYRAARQQSPHVVENLLVACQTALGRLAPLVATEVAVLRYAVAGAWARPEVGAGEEPFSTYRQAGTPALLGALGALVVLEGVAAHLVLMRWFPGAAWVLTAGSGYSLLWLLAHGQALRCRPVLLSEEMLVVRVGFCWRAAVPRSQVVAAQVLTGDLPASAAGCLNLAKLLFTPPNMLLRLTEPQVVQGPFGLRRTSNCLACYVDEPQALVRQLAAGAA